VEIADNARKHGVADEDIEQQSATPSV